MAPAECISSAIDRWADPLGARASAFGPLVPLVAADLTRGHNGFFLCLGLFGVAMGVDATLSIAIGGTLAERYGFMRLFSPSRLSVSGRC